MAYPQAMNAIQKAAENGDVEAQLYLGRCYQEGKNGVNKNLQEANKWLLKAAQQGHLEAQYELSQLLVGNNLYDDCIKDGLYWMKKAADNGHVFAMGNFGYLSFYENNYDYAFKYSYLAVQSSNPPIGSYVILGNCYLYGLGTEKNTVKAQELFTTVADAGNSMAYALAAQSCLLNKVYDKALLYANKAVEAGDNTANITLAQIYSQGLGVNKAPSKVVSILNTFIQSNSSTDEKLKAYDLIINEFREDKSGTLNKQDLVGYMEKSANLGNPYSSYMLGYNYATGNDDFPINYEKAKNWYKKAAEKGFILGFNNLAFLYAQGNGVQQSYKEAYKLLDEALDLYDKQGNHFEDDWTRENLLDTKGEILLMEGRFDDALTIYNQIKNTDDQKIKDSAFFAQMASYLSHSIDAINFTANTNNEKTFVVIIANENYKRVDGVPYALNDGKLFQKYCTQALGIPESNIKFFDDASGNDIKFGVNWLKQAASVHVGQSKIIFYYAGHGIPDESNKNAYLLPVDGYGSDISTGYSLEELYSTLGSIPAKNVMVFLDACFSGTKRDGSMLASARGVAIKAKQTAPSGKMVVLSAAQGDETAYPFEDQKHGMFTYYLLRKLLETKGEATLGDLADYVTSEVAKQSVIQNNKAQTPTVSHSALSSDWRNWKLK